MRKVERNMKTKNEENGTTVNTNNARVTEKKECEETI